MSNRKRKKTKTSELASHQNSSRKEDPKDAHALFLRNLFTEYCKVEKFYNKWFLIEDICKNINSYFYIDRALFVQPNDLRYHVFRQKSFQLAFELGENTCNNLGVYRANYRKNRNEVHYIYQTTSTGKLPQHPVSTSTLLIEKNPVDVSPTQRKYLQGTVLDTNAQKQLCSMLGIKWTGRYEEGSVSLPDTMSECSDFESILGEEGTTCSQVDDDDSSDCSRTLAREEILPQSIDAPSPYWYSTEAKRLFAAKEDRNAFEEVLLRIAALDKALKTGDFSSLIHQYETHKPTDHQMYCLKNKALYMKVALQLATEKMNKWTWDECCHEALRRCNAYSINRPYTTNSRVIRNWHTEFRKSNNFILPYRSKRGLPDFLEDNDDAVSLIVRYACSKLSELSVELMYNYLHCNVIPSMIRMRRDRSQATKPLSHYVAEPESNNSTVTDAEKQALLKEYGLKELCLATVNNWMLKLGFKYETRRKCYYVDNHEKPETVEYRWGYVNRYLNYELRSHRWIQIPVAQARSIMRDGKSIVDYDFGHPHTSRDGQEMIEFHVDDVPELQELANAILYGGNPSVLKADGDKLVFMFGHDEACFRQNSFTTKAWVTPTGQRCLIPKDEGRSIMISAFQSREFGFGMTLTADQLGRINAHRRGTDYDNKDAAIRVKGSQRKKDLAESPFTVEFEYGQNNNGYWTYDHLIVQIEDCVDCLKVLYPQYEYLFQFDHSCGHDRQREDGLHVSNINLHYGGKQRKMRDSKIVSVDGYLGSYTKSLQVGETQKMSFVETDEGPSYMSPTERVKRKYDVVSGQIITRNYTKKELILKLQQHPTPVTDPRGNLTRIHEMCASKGIPIHETKPKIIEGWCNKPKGILQILLERGLVDRDNLSKYSLNGKKGADGEKIPGTSLIEILAQCADFKGELTMLDLAAKDLGFLVEKSPKCHPENAGEGVEYSWGCSKAYYRNMKFEDKKGYSNFRKSVRKAISNEVLTTARVRSFSAKARRYIITYLCLTAEKRRQLSSDPALFNATRYADLALPHEEIERVQKTFKTHRNIFDSHKGMIVHALQTDDIN
jgi:hypothetical protein